MRNYLKGTAIALLLSGTALASAGTARADDYSHNDRANSAITVQFGDVSMGYRDGYWDNSHNWHRWNSDNDYRTYRQQHSDTYRDWNHDRDGSTVTIGLTDVAFGYRAGYFDNRHHWHHWRHKGDYQNYRDRDQNGSNGHDTNHDHGDNNGGQGH